MDIDALRERARRADEDPPPLRASDDVVDEWVLVPRAHLRTIQSWAGQIDEAAAITMCGEIFLDARLIGRAKEITDYQQLHDLPQHQVVRDAAGRVWCVVKPKSQPGDTWLVPFSDEYAYIVSTETSALGETPELPIVDLGVTSTGGG